MSLQQKIGIDIVAFSKLTEAEVSRIFPGMPPVQKKGVPPYQKLVLPEYTDRLSGQTLRAMDEDELDLFNLDLRSIAADYCSEPVIAAASKYQRESLVVCRAVMYTAKQPYGGANSLGTEITCRLIKPVDMNYTIEEIWDQNLSGEAVGDIWGFQTGGTTPADDTMGEEEGNIIWGWSDPVALCGFASYQVLKAGRTWPYYTISFTHCRADSIPFMEARAPIPEYPEETVRIQMDVGRAINPDRMQAIGLHFCRASAIVAATGSA